VLWCTPAPSNKPPRRLGVLLGAPPLPSARLGRLHRPNAGLGGREEGRGWWGDEVAPELDAFRPEGAAADVASRETEETKLAVSSLSFYQVQLAVSSLFFYQVQR
jgi:hypothetical protein